MSTLIDSSKYLTKGYGCGNTAGCWHHNGKLYLAATRQTDLNTVYVQVWVYSGGSWTGYTGPQVQRPAGVGNAYVISSIAADVIDSTMWIAYSGAADPSLPQPHVVMFDMTGLSFGAPITDYPNSVGYGSYTNTHTFSGGTPITGDLPFWNFIYATGPVTFTLLTHGTKGGVQHLNIVKSDYNSGWSSTRIGRDSFESDLAVASLRDGSGNKHVWFVDATGTLYHEIIGGSGPTVVTTGVKVVSGTGSDGRVDITGATVGKPAASGTTLYIPYKDSSNNVSIATYSGGSWSTATVDSTKSIYAHWFASAARESDCGNICAAYVLSGVPEVLWWDDQNNLDSADGSPAPVTETLWRSRYTGGSWQTPTSLESATAWQRDIDVAVSGATAHVVIQKFDSVWLTPHYLTIGGSSNISAPGIAKATTFGSFSGITGGVQSGEGCGSGPRLPSSAGTINPRCSTYTAL